MTVIVVLIGIVLAFVVIARLFLAGATHTEFDQPIPVSMGQEHRDRSAHRQVVEGMQADQDKMAQVPESERMQMFHQSMEEMGAAVQSSAIITPCRVAGGIDAEWVIAPHANEDKRLLYIHGGGFAIGSALSHRSITTELSQRLGMAVLAINYRLIPKHSRRDGITDCQMAYNWICANSVSGQSECESLVLAGDSAGGNLVLMLLAWARDADLRHANAAIAMSPLTDSTLSSPSLKRNVDTDVMLGPMMVRITKIPKTVLLWGAFLLSRIRPNNTLVSPLHGDLSNLPPTLLQASEAEMLLDDSVRYANKAIRAGSVAQIQTWPEMVHVWQIFVAELPEAVEAFDEMEAFVNRHVTAAD